MFFLIGFPSKQFNDFPLRSCASHAKGSGKV